MEMGDAELHPADGDLAQIRESVRALCARFPGEYWRKLDRERGYPAEFVAALTEAGFLAALIPEEYGGSGLTMNAAAAIMEEIQASGCNGAACHAQMYTMGTLLRHGSTAQKSRWLPAIASGALRLQAFGVTEPTSGSDTLNLRTTAVREGDHYIINGQKIWTSRAEHSDLLLLLARTTPREQAKRRTDGLSVFLVDMRLAQGTGISVNPIRTMMNHATTELFFDDLRVPAENLIGEEGQGFRYILSGMNAERILIAAECIGDAKWFIQKATAYAKERVVFGRPIGQNQGVQFPIARAYAQMRAAELMVREAALLYEAGARLRRRGQHGEAARRRCLLGCRRHVPADPRRLRLRRGVRHRAQVPRDQALSNRADLDQPDPVLSRRARARPAAVLLKRHQPGAKPSSVLLIGQPIRYQIVVSPGNPVMSQALLADIGGSKSRFALANSAGRPERILVIDNDTAADLEAAVARYLEETGARPQTATFAIAGPIDGEEVALTNRSWRFRRGELARRFGFSQLRVLNDFEAIAWALPCLGAADTRPLGQPAARRDGVKVVLGPGTGLGVAALLPVRTAAGRWWRARADMPRSARRRPTRSTCSRGCATNAAP